MSQIEVILKNIEEFLKDKETVEYGTINIHIKKHDGEYVTLEKRIEESVKIKVVDLV